MSLSRAWLSGCQPIVRACVSTKSLHIAPNSLLTSRLCISHNRLATLIGRDHRLAAVHRAFPNRTLASASSSLEDQVKEKNKKHTVIVYSKSWCPYCGQVKGLFQDLKVDFIAVELDEVVEGEEVMDALQAITSSRTVPQVFINGEFIGGCDDTMGAYSSGELAEKFSEAGVDANF